MTRGDRILQLADALARALDSIAWAAPVTHAYDPLVYARAGFERFVARALADGGTRRVLLVGLNPGPHGAVQTGVPFGDPGWARALVGADVEIGQPSTLHPDRPVHGIRATRTETSGRRLWDGLTQIWTGSPATVPDAELQRALDTVLADVFVMNYCPVALFDVNGKNVTPEDLRKLGARPDLDHLLTCCDEHLRDVVRTLDPAFVIGIGNFARDRASRALGNAWTCNNGAKLRIGKVLHPSPQSSLANTGWLELARKELRAGGVIR